MKEREPASVRLEWPSPYANVKPPMTIATKLSPVAIGSGESILQNVFRKTR